MRRHLPGTDTHVLVVGANGRDFTLDLAAPFARAAGGTHITELAQHFGLKNTGFCGKKKEEKKVTVY